VVAALVKDKTLPDPFFATNLRQFPGMTYPIGANFSNLAMQPDSPYAVSWWYRKQFAAPASYAGKTVWLNFKGINYRANVWLNGKQIANSNDIAGAWRTYELNVTEALKPGRGIPHHPTKIWDCGVRSTSPPLARLLCAIPPLCRT
jgi:exo-1,4-beta-D-glucosaminidase